MGRRKRSLIFKWMMSLSEELDMSIVNLDVLVDGERPTLFAILRNAVHLVDAVPLEYRLPVRRGDAGQVCEGQHPVPLDDVLAQAQ